MKNPAKPISNRALGDLGETIAEDFLKKEGYRILERNARSPLGEIDVVAKDGKVLVFVEIKTRRNLSCGYPEEAINANKRKRLSRLASWYLCRFGGTSEPVRFDVLSILLRSDEKPRIRLIRNAFEYMA